MASPNQPRLRALRCRNQRRPILERLETRNLLSGAGSLDPTFGTGGIVITSPTKSNDFGSGVLLQSNGDLIAFGQANVNSSISGSGLVRYTPSGKLDSTFGSGGIVTNRLGGIGNAALDSSGRILAGGAGDLVRYNSNGSIDQTFGSKGVVTYPSNFSGNGGLVIQPSSGDIVVGGSVGFPREFALLRYSANGTLVNTFGNGGEVFMPVGNGNSDLHCVAMESGDILAGGGTLDAAGNNVWAIARYTPTGGLDTSFGPNGTGIVTTLIAGGGSIAALLVQGDGKIVAVGTVGGGPSKEWALARYDAFGNLDTTFGSGGTVTNSFTASGDALEAAALQSNGQIVVAGFQTTSSTARTQFEVGRYNTDGTLDTTFGSGGFVETASGTDAQAYGVVIQTDGNIVAGGGTDINGKYDFMLARYLGAATTTALAPAIGVAQTVGASITPIGASIAEVTGATASDAVAPSSIDWATIMPTAPVERPAVAADAQPGSWDIDLS